MEKHYSSDLLTREKKTDIPPRRTVDFEHMAYHVKLDEKKGTIEGRVEHRVRPLLEGTREVFLHADTALTIRSVTLAEKKQKLKFKRDGNDLSIDLGRRYGPKASLTLVISYKGSPTNGIHFIRPDKGYPKRPYQIWTQGESEETHYWLPAYDFPNDKVTSEAWVTVRKPYMVIGNGELAGVEKSRDGKWNTYHWQQDIPHPAYLTSLVIGDFEELHDECDGIPLTAYVRKGEMKKAVRAFQKTADMMRFFTKKIGLPYPYKKYSQVCVEDFTFGGMENVSATTLTTYALKDERALLNGDCDLLVAHELAHQWWGDHITCRDWSQLWLNEGFATYFESLYCQHDLGEDDFKLEMVESARTAIDDDEKNRRPVVDEKFSNHEEIFDGHPYGKGAWILHMLRGYLGDDAWWRGVQLYAKRHAGKNVVTADMRCAFEDAAGQPLKDFFAQWTYKAGEPHFKVRWDYDENRKCVTLDVKQTQETTDLVPIFEVRVPVEITTSQGRKIYPIDLDSKEQRLHLFVSSKPLMVSFDKNGWTLKKLDFKKHEEELLYQLENDSDCLGRMFAAKELAKYPTPASVSALCKALKKEKFWGVRRHVARCLSKVESDSSRDALLGATQDQDARIRATAASSLSAFDGDAKVSKRLGEIFAKDRSYVAQAESLLALAKVDEKAARPLIKKALKISSYREIVRRKAYESLVELKDDKAVKTLEDAMAYGQPIGARIAAAESFAELIIKCAKGEAKRIKGAARVLLAYVQDPRFQMRLATVNALKKLGDPVALPALAEAAEHDHLPRIKIAAYDALKGIREKIEKAAKKDS